MRVMKRVTKTISRPSKKEKRKSVKKDGYFIIVRHIKGLRKVLVMIGVIKPAKATLCLNL